MTMSPVLFLLVGYAMRCTRPVNALASRESDVVGSASRHLRDGLNKLPAARLARASTPAPDHSAGTSLRKAASLGPSAVSCPASLLSLRGDIPDGERQPDRNNAGNRIVPELPTRSAPAAIAAALSVVLILASCQERLAQRDAYFAPLSGLSVSLHSETEHVLDYHQAMQTALHRCNASQRATETSSVMGPANVVPEGALDPDAQARLCASSGITHATHGAPLNGYRRWVGDQVRELPAPSETASSIGGGS